MPSECKVIEKSSEVISRAELEKPRKRDDNRRELPAILINGIFKYGKHEGLTQLSITQLIGDLKLPRNLFEVTEVNIEAGSFCCQFSRSCI